MRNSVTLFPFPTDKSLFLSILVFQQQEAVGGKKQSWQSSWVCALCSDSGSLTATTRPSMSSCSASEGDSSEKELLILLINSSLIFRLEVGSQRTQGAFHEWARGASPVVSQVDEHQVVIAIARSYRYNESNWFTSEKEPAWLYHTPAAVPNTQR